VIIIIIGAHQASCRMYTGGKAAGAWSWPHTSSTSSWRGTESSTGTNLPYLTSSSVDAN